MSSTLVTAVRPVKRLLTEFGAGISKNPESRRLLDRFCVPGAMAECYRRSWLFFWKRMGPLCKIHDMCLCGVSLRNMGQKLTPKSMVRLNILLAPEMWVRVKARVVWIKDDETRQGQFCGLQFTDFSGKAWFSLCLVYEKYRGKPEKTETDLTETFDIEQLHEDGEPHCGVTEALA